MATLDEILKKMDEPENILELLKERDEINKKIDEYGANIYVNLLEGLKADAENTEKMIAEKKATIKKGEVWTDLSISQLKQELDPYIQLFDEQHKKFGKICEVLAKTHLVKTQVEELNKQCDFILKPIYEQELDIFEAFTDVYTIKKPYKAKLDLIISKLREHESITTKKTYLK